LTIISIFQYDIPAFPGKSLGVC